MSAAPGGFLESCATAIVRPRPTITLPDRGPFDMPAPWGTRAIRITNVSDTAGVDCLEPCGYSYWPKINAHVGQAELLVFCCFNRNQGGAGPSLFAVDKTTEQVTPLGPLFSPDHPLSWATGEGWYFSRTDPDVLYVSDLARLYRLRISTRQLDPVIDITQPPYAWSGKVLWQFHSSADERVHSATVKNGSTYQPEGCIVYREGQTRPWTYFPQVHAVDECQIDKSGRYLLIKDQLDAEAGEDNAIQDLERHSTRIILDQAGAAGHSDNGFGYMVAADNWNDKPGALRVWMFDEAQDPQGVLCYHSPSWDSELQHLSHVNAQPAPPAGQMVVGSGASGTLSARANEICAFRLDGSLEVLVIAPVMTDMNAAGGGDAYRKLPKGCVDITGDWFFWTSNHGTDRLDAFLCRVPQQRLIGGAPEPPPTPRPYDWTISGWGAPPVLTRL